MQIEAEIRAKYRALAATMNERVRRLWAGTEAKALGRGGIAIVVRATGLARNTVCQGLRDLRRPGRRRGPERVRRAGGGRKAATALDPTLASALEGLVEPVTRGDPESPLRWTCHSTRHLATALAAQGHGVSHVVVAQLLARLGYSLQANRKTQEGRNHPDRNAQFAYLNAAVAAQLRRGHPAVSVDTKKKELVGPFKNAGRTWRPQGQPAAVRVHDFLDPALGKAIPYGVYDLAQNAGWVSVGVDHDTAAFAVATLRHWWQGVGRRRYPAATSLLIVADSGGSNGARVRLWKWELQRFATQQGLTITVGHLPPGTSKWNKIEHRLFSFISQNWRGQPLLTHAVIVNLIAATRTRAGLTVRCVLDSHQYPKAVHVTDAQMASIRLTPHLFHGDWNYTIHPEMVR